MLDLETLGTRAGSVILSIGACAFDLTTGYMGDNFHVFLRPKEQLAMGATMDPDTILWWLKQSDSARHSMVLGQEKAVTAHEAIMTFRDWLNMQHGGAAAARIWSNGADFDIPLLAELYRKLGYDAPWPYNAGRDMRTVMALAGGYPPKWYKSAPIGAHNALVDAIYQADVIALALKRINGERK